MLSDTQVTRFVFKALNTSPPQNASHFYEVAFRNLRSVKTNPEIAVVYTGPEWSGLLVWSGPLLIVEREGRVEPNTLSVSRLSPDARARQARGRALGTASPKLSNLLECNHACFGQTKYVFRRNRLYWGSRMRLRVGAQVWSLEFEILG